MRNEKGFSLIELLISITIFAIALLGLQVLQILAVKQVSGGDMLNGANTALISLLEELNSYTIEELTNDTFKASMISKGDFGTAITGTFGGGGNYKTKYDFRGDGDTANDIYTLEWEIKTKTTNTDGSIGSVIIDARVQWFEQIGLGKLPVTADPDGNRELRGVTVIR